MAGAAVVVASTFINFSFVFRKPTSLVSVLPARGTICHHDISASQKLNVTTFKVSTQECAKN
ncbi:hypothetical protein CCACVL1_06910 [Corchorus capsularis]|uniref:Uncharacterized protein n=1 Tax=Corchorus capsularis TaxID=210143 RepID=A0A1R3JBH4_COCAP|nr:hypothetical protein CCACVL1_06910 [Corchorus capsularis]